MTGHRYIYGITLLLCLLVGITGIAGTTMPELYAAETLNWRTQAIGQDLLNCALILPVLIITTILYLSGYLPALLCWTGTVLYLAYTFTIYCFSIHFNFLFVIYCAILGICVYSILAILRFNPLVTPVPSRKVHKTAAIFLIATAVIFYILWLSGILPANIHHFVPKSLIETKLPTNPVHVLDLSLFLPTLAATGVLALKGNKGALTMMPVLLTFMILMDLTIAGLNLFMMRSGLTGETAITIIMFLSAVFSSILLLLILRSKTILL